MSSSTCLSRDRLADYLVGKLPDELAASVNVHLEACERCMVALASLSMPSDSLVSTLRGMGEIPRVDDPELSRLVELAFAVASPDRDADRFKTVNVTPTPRGAPTGGPNRPRQLDQYRLLEELGAGGMGQVFKALHVGLERQVALKVIRRDAAGNAAALARFQQEIRAMGKLGHHPHLVHASDAREADGVVFLVMDLIDGIDLSKLVRRLGPLSPADACELARHAALGLQHAHQCGLVHRDVKPSNLILSRDGLVKVLDLGLARHDVPAAGQDRTATGQVMGSFDYLAPEQARDAHSVDIRADIYSLGCSLFHLLVGRPPFADDQHVDPFAKLYAHVHEPFPAIRELRPDVPEAVASVVARMTARRPDDRYRTPAEAARALEPLAKGANLIGLLAALDLAPPLRPADVGPNLVSTAMPVTPIDVQSKSTLASVAPISPSQPLGKRQLVAGLAAFAAVAVGVMLASWFTLWPPWKPVSVADKDRTVPTPEAAYRGEVDVIVWTKKGGAPRKLRLHDAGALPLGNGDQIRITARVQPAAFLYLFWIDSEGAAMPVYPWQPGKWETRPAVELPVTQLELPTSQTKGFTLTGGATGMETLVMLARDSKLPDDDEELRRELGGLPPQRPVQNAQSAVWFENGLVVENDPQRQRAFYVEEIDDPVLRLQAKLKEKLQPRGRYSAAVSFARKGP